MLFSLIGAVAKMEINKNLLGNIERFTGFTDCYDKYKPEAVGNFKNISFYS
jgi:hypothetical protein